MSPARERFAAVVAAPDDAIDLAEAALLIAAEESEQDGLEGYLGHYLELLDSLAAGARRRVRNADELGSPAALIEYLAKECRFRGNQDDYYDRRNSYLSDVLDRRVGIPITLAIVYIEIGRRAGLDIRGVGFPGHFLAQHNGAEPTIIDPFYGVVLDRDACAERLRAIAGPDAVLAPEMLSIASTREIISRMLGNLKIIYLRSRSFSEALSCSERILLVNPDHPIELRDRAALYLQLECFDAARKDLERFLEVAPDHDSAELVHGELVKLRARGPSLH